MFSKLACTAKRVWKAVTGTIRSLAVRGGKAFANLVRCSAVSVAGGSKAAILFFVTCFRLFGKSVKGYGALVKRFFADMKKDGFKSAVRLHRESLRSARDRHSRLFSKCAVVSVPLMLMVLVGITAPVWANFTFAKRVVYAQTVLGDILDVKTYDSAKDFFVKAVVSDNAASYLEAYSLNTVYVKKTQVLSAEHLAEQMLHSTKALVNGYGLYIDNALALVSETAAPIYTNLSAMLEKNKNGNTAAQAAFIQAVEVRDGYYPVADCANSAAVENAFLQNTLQLSVKTTIMQEYDEAVPYAINKTDTNALALGRTKTVIKGQNGTKHITARVTYVNGTEIERVITDTEVVKTPVTQQVLVGTKKTYAKTTASASSKVMLWPIPASARYQISSNFNEDRTSHFHQGVDIACDKGTPIYAVMAGTVSVVKTTGSYGMHIMIDHGNNVVTVYAHCSALYVSKGDKVAKGEQIAAVGNTGNSTGNHLHFEVRINGKKYDPMHYLDK